jgi:hypothetical protein
MFHQTLVHRRMVDANKLYKLQRDKGIIKENYGYRDGLIVDINGNIFASGPDGVLVLSPSGKLIGKFRLDKPVSLVVAFGGDGWLCFTDSDKIVRICIRPFHLIFRKNNCLTIVFCRKYIPIFYKLNIMVILSLSP